MANWPSIRSIIIKKDKFALMSLENVLHDKNILNDNTNINKFINYIA